MKIIFGRNSHWISKWIQRETWSRWSHVGIIDGDYVIEAKGISPLPMFLVLLGLKKNSISLGGVIKTPLPEFYQRYNDTKIAYLDGDIEIARRMVGTVMFDPWGMLGLYIKKRIHCSDKVFCAKMVALCATNYRNRFAYRATSQRILEMSRDNP